VSKILYLRQNYHFGPRKIADYLKRFHQVSVAGATVHRILVKHGLRRLPANQKHQHHAKRWKRYEKPQPGHRLQVDVKFLERIPGTRKRLYQFTAIDDCTRIRVLKIYDACNQTTAIRFADDVVRRLPFRIHVIQTDNGAEFQSKFHWHLQELGIRHVYIRPRTPRLNGKVERSHRVDAHPQWRIARRFRTNFETSGRVFETERPRSPGTRPQRPVSVCRIASVWRSSRSFAQAGIGFLAPPLGQIARL